MSLSICTSCLARLRISSPSTIPRPVVPAISKSSFHSSPIQQGDGQNKKKKATGKNVYRITSSQTYKKKRRVVGKLPPAGERRMLRKRIVLSNTNAYEIKGLQDLSPQNMADEAYVGHMLGLEGNTLDQLRHAKAFKKTQNWNLFRRPATLVRPETVELGKKIELVSQSLLKDEGSKREVRKQIIAGERISGKSILLLQALSMGYMNKWIVINIPETQDFVIDQSSYEPSRREGDSSEDQTYVQPHLASELLQRLAASNLSVLQTLRPNHTLPQSLTNDKKPDTLHAIATIGAENPRLAHRVWEHIWKEITVSGSQPRPPVLVAIDGLDHWMGPTKYRSADFEIIHAHQFVLIRQFLSLLFSNAQPLPYGGMVLGATARSNSPVYPTFDVLLKQVTALNQGLAMTDENFPMPTPYAKADAKVLSLLSPIQPPSTTITTLQGLSKQHTQSLLAYYADSGILKLEGGLNPLTISESWTLSSGGVIGELCKVGRAVRIDPEKVITRFGTGKGIAKGRGQGEHRGLR